MRNLPVCDISSRLDHLIPIHVLDRERGLGNRVAYRLIGTLGLGADQFDELVSLCGHDVSPIKND